MFKIFSKKIIFIFVILAFNLIIGVRTSIDIFYLFFWFLAATLAINFFWVTLEYLGVRLYLERNIVAKIEEDDTVDIEVNIKNNGWVPAVNFVLEDCLTCAAPNETQRLTLIDYLGRRSAVRLRYSSICPKRGRYILGPFRVYFFDPFGLFFFKKTYDVYSELYVYPKTFPIKRFPPLAKGIMPWFGIDTIHTSGDDDEFFGVREYREGDPIKRIHWISSARKNSLIVKQFQRQSYFRATIIFNLEKDKNFGEGKETVAEYIIKIAASVAKYLIDLNVSVEIIAHVGEIVHIPFNKGRDHLEDILKFLSLAQPESRVSICEIFQEHARYIADNSSLIIIMLDKDWEYLPEMLPLGKRNISLIPLIILSSTFIYMPEKRDVITDVRQKVSQLFNFNPIIFSRQDKLEESFLRY